MVTIKDLAQQLNLSSATVSRALSGKSTVNKATYKRVRALATKLGYQPNVLAVGLRKGHTNTLGVIMPHLNSNFFSHVVTGIEDTASRAGYRVLICQSNDDAERERQNLDMLLRAQVDGVLLSLARTTIRAHQFDNIRLRNLPLVFFDRYLEGDNGNAVIIDDRAGGYYATRHLLEQGYRRIAHVAGPQHISVYKNRRLGYEDALREYGLPILPALLVTCDLRLQDGVLAAHQLLAQPPRPDAIFSASDFAALGIMQVMKEEGIQLPQDMGLVGFSNELFSQFTEPALTTIDQHGEAMGRQATKLLLHLLRETPLSTATQHIILPPTLLVRGSSTRRQQGPADQEPVKECVSNVA
ncbi:LacI family DNA-binding transcriptional regulator [Hymenobacter mucosus]|uniref:Transcriptional regulator, LacI family n=1 Tax=Hymenobacter mucosus TaxID=1411120 RepID=A0A239BDP4_9BACT|nr:LacI family DNA-binding transcriptional regulator [Hymenobacter mucosus]SNS06125.1 transcriptional regulator, LacI family [Hymenobacter mucosus]